MEVPNLLAKRILVAAVMGSLLFLSLLLVTPASAEDEEPVVVVSGGDTAFNKNVDEDYNGPLPVKDYESSPPVMAAARVGSGAVVAAGTSGTCIDNPLYNAWNLPKNPYPYFDKLLDVTFQWMVPGATNLLWYEGHEVYAKASSCENLISSLENMGYSIGTDGRAFENIENLADYDILVVPQMQLGAVASGGDPTLLPDVDVQAIVNFVEDGGGLLIMEQADYQGYNYCEVQNKILKTLDLNIRFQSDQVQDDANKWGGQIYQPIVNIDTTTDIGSAYESETGVSVVGLGSLCSIRIVVDYDVNARVSPTTALGGGGETLTYEGEIANIGTESDSYTITIEDELGWSPSASLGEVSLENGKSVQVDIEVTVPGSLTEKVVDWITLKAVGASGAEDNTRFRAINCLPVEEPPYPIAYPEEPHFWFSICTQLVEPPAVPIMTGVETGYGEDLTEREPQPLLACRGEYPVVAAAALAGNGRVITTGPACLRSSPVDYYTNPTLATRDFAPLWPQWLIDWENPENQKFLYYCTDPKLYPATFHAPDMVAVWLDDVGENGLGFEVDTQVGGEITPELLEEYDVLQIGELKRPLTSDEKQAIKEWVEGGGGLILMCQADYSGYGAAKYPNAVLEALDVPITFQDDELYDEDSYVIDGPWFPEVYLLDPREANPDFDVWFPRHNPVIRSLSPKVISVNGMRAVFKLTIKNGGTVDSTFGIEVEETSDVGWSVDVEPEIELGPGETAEVYIKVTVPELDQSARMDLLAKFTDKGAPYLTKSEFFAAFGDAGWTKPSAKFEVGQMVYHESLGECTVQDKGWNGSSVVYAVKTTGGALAYVPEDQLSSTGPTPPTPSTPSKPLTWVVVFPAAAVVILIVTLILLALGVRWG